MSYFPEAKELTRFGFISNMESFIKDLLTNPLKADVTDYLKGFDIDKNKALKMLLKKHNPKDDRSAVLICIEKIKPEKLSEEEKLQGKTPKDKFNIQYKLIKDNYKEKMKTLYNNMKKSYIKENQVFQNENQIIDDIMAMDKDNAYKNRGGMKKMNEDGECAGATTCDASSGQFTQPLFGKPLRRKILVTEEQLEYIKEATTTMSCGDYQYTIPFGVGKNDPTMNHKNILGNSNLSESRQGLSSKKLFDIFQKYGKSRVVGHWSSSEGMDLHNVTDDDVIGVFKASDLQGMNQGQLKSYFKQKGFNINNKDFINDIELATPANNGELLYVLVINRDPNNLMNSFNKKQSDRNKHQRNDGAQNYKWKGNVSINPYYKEWGEPEKEILRNRIKDIYGEKRYNQAKGNE